jgi:hypothetical protein
LPFGAVERLPSGKQAGLLTDFQTNINKKNQKNFPFSSSSHFLFIIIEATTISLFLAQSKTTYELEVVVDGQKVELEGAKGLE